MCIHDKEHLKFYDGALGYEAMYCPICGYYSDVNGEEGYDDFYKGLTR